MPGSLLPMHLLLTSSSKCRFVCTLTLTLTLQHCSTACCLHLKGTWCCRHLAGKAKLPPPPQRVNRNTAVLTLSERSFDQALSEHEIILVKFYAPWCGHCKKLAPDYERAATTLRNAGISVALAKIDATTERGPTARFAIQGYPTLRECCLDSWLNT